MIIHINGWPGVGKRTIGVVLAKRLGARFIHNHLLHDVAIVCAGLDCEARWDLYEKVRSAAYQTLAAHPSSELFVMTNALCNNSGREREAWRHIVDLAISRNTPLVPVVLTVEQGEHLHRLESPERIGKKMTDSALLKEYFNQDTIQQPDVPELLMLDVTGYTPEQAADSIVQHVEAVRPHLMPATSLHLRMRDV
jgi:gluconate kinase